MRWRKHTPFLAGALAGICLVLAFPALNFVLTPTRFFAKEAILSGSNPMLRSANASAEAVYTSADPLFGRQAGLEESGFPEAWSVTRGHGVKVAVVDSGIAASHPDLAGRIAAERDFVNDDLVAEDTTGHGTHVAGMIAAGTDNREGIAGGCPGCQLLVAKALGVSGGDASSVSEAIRWGADGGADVINVSFTGPNTEDLKDAVDHAQGEGAVVVAAAPNPGASTQGYPAAYDGVLAVTMADCSRLGVCSDYGDWVDVAAPGADVLSTSRGGDYRTDDGTSQASPHVAALAALLAGQGCSPEEILSRIRDTAVDVGDPGFDERYGFGSIDAAQAVRHPCGFLEWVEAMMARASQGSARNNV